MFAIERYGVPYARLRARSRYSRGMAGAGAPRCCCCQYLPADAGTTFELKWVVGYFTTTACPWNPVDQCIFWQIAFGSVRALAGVRIVVCFPEFSAALPNVATRAYGGGAGYHRINSGTRFRSCAQARFPKRSPGIFSYQAFSPAQTLPPFR